MKSVRNFVFLLLTLFIPMAHAAPGDLDPLNPTLVGNYVLATAVQPDGKLILAGKFTSVLGVARNNLARLNADGTLDGTFNPNPNGDVNAVTVQPDGKILIGGSFTSVVAMARNSIARLNADGTLDTGFNPNANGAPMSIVLQADGKVLLAGDFTTLQPNGAASATTRNRLARLNADGSLDTAFNPNANDRVVSMALQADGKILVSGYFLTLQPNGAASATTRNRIARLNSDGTLDTGFNPNANNWVNSLALEPDGQILLGGDFTSLQPNGAASATTRNRIARLNSDGTLDTGFDPNANGSVLGIAVQADGKVLLGGYFIALQPNGAASSTARNCIARVNADGTLDAAFDPKPNNALFGLALQADGKVLLGGLFSTLQPNGAASDTTRSLFARVANDGAVSTVSVPSATQVLWTRSGSAPEASRVTFELSTDSGASWSALGNGTRVGTTSNWQLTGLSLPASGVVRARGATTHGYFNGSSGLVESSVSFPAPPSDPVAWLKAEGNATDATSNANNGVVNGSVPYVTGKVGNSFNFTGNVANYIRIPNSASLQSTLLTVEYWVNFNSATNAVTVAKRNGSSDAWQAGIVYSGGNFLLQFVGNTPGGLFDWYSASIASPVGVWTHVATTYDGSTVRGYVNGVQVINLAVTLQLGLRTADIYVGNYAGTALPFDGKVDELSIYNRALSATEVQAIYQAGSAGKTAPAPTVTGVSPSSGSTLGGTSVTITGTNFTGATAVTFGGNAASGVTVVNNTTITATTPARAAGTASVVVTTPGGSNAANSLYTYVTPAPTVASVTPPSGSTLGGTNVTITGTNFTGTTGVTIGGNAATGVTVVNPSTITAITPAGNAGTASVVVTTSGGSNAANSLFSYVAPAPTVTGVSPSSGSISGGTNVTITGTNFTGATAVTFGGNAASGVTVVNATTITATTPARTAGAASVVVTTPSGSNAANSLFTYGVANQAPGFQFGVYLGEPAEPWTPRETVQGWTSIASSADGQKLVACGLFNFVSTDYIYRSTDGGATWSLTGGYNFWDRVCSSADGSTILAAPYGGGRLSISNDSGATWMEVPVNRTWTGLASSADGTKLAGATTLGIVTSADGGATWTDRELNNSWGCIASSADGTKLVAGRQYNGRLYTSTDSGVTWTPRATNHSWISVASSADGTKLVAADFGNDNGTGGRLYTSTDSGVTWTARGSQRLWLSVASSASGLYMAAAARNGKLYTSSDAGVTWTERESNRDWRCIASSADGSKLAAAAYGSTLYTSPRYPVGITWESGSGPFSRPGFLAEISPGPSSEAAQSVTFEASTNNPALFAVPPAISANGTLTFTLGTSAGVATVSVVARDNGGTAFGGSDASAVQTFTITALAPVVRVTGVSPSTGSVEGGTAVVLTGTAFTGATSVSFGGTAATSFTVVNETTIQATAPAHASGGVSVEVSAAAGSSTPNSLFRYLANSAPSFFLPYTQGDVTAPWTARDTTRNWTSAAASADGMRMAAVVDGGKIYTSEDGGLSWRPQESNRAWRSIACSSDGAKLVAAAYGGQIYTSTDRGETWTPRESVKNWVAVASSADGVKLAAVEYGGLAYISENSGVTWLAMDSPYPYTCVDVAPDGSWLSAGFENGTVYLAQLGLPTWGAPQSYFGRNWRTVAFSKGFDRVACADNEYLYTSVDGSVTPRLTDAPRAWRGIDVTEDGSKVAAVEFGGRIYTSNDRGVTWAPCESIRNWRFITCPSGGNGWVALTDSQLFTSPRTMYNYSAPARSGQNTVGQFVKNILAGPSNEAWQSVSFQVTNDNNALFTTQPSLSSNGTLTFTPGNSTGVATVTVTARDNGGTLSGGVDTSIAQTFTITLTPPLPNVAPSFALRGLPGNPADPWIPCQTIPDLMALTSSADGVKLAAAAGSNGLWYSLNSGVTWTKSSAVGAAPFAAIDSSADGAKLVATDQLDAYTSIDSGVTWTKLARFTPPLTLILSVAISADGSRLAATNYQGLIYISNDGGATWTDRAASRNWSSITMSADGNKMAAVDSGGKIHTSADGGITWTERLSDASRSWVGVTSSADGNTLLAAAFSDYLYVSHDAGATWTAKLTDASRRWTSIAISADGMNLFAGPDDYAGQLHVSSDGGVTWSDAVEGPVYAIASSANGQKLLLVGGLNGERAIFTNPMVSFNPGVVAGSGPRTIAGLAEGITPGPAATEAWQTVTFQTTNSNNALFLVQPSIDSSGTLAFTPGYLGGTATVSVIAIDNGGTTYGGTDTSAPQTFTITVTPDTSPLGVWRQAQFGTATAGIGDNDDFDGDGLVNLIEYGLVRSPTQLTAAPAAELHAYPVGDRLRMILQRDPARSDVTIEVQATGDLTGAWTILATSSNGAPFTGLGYVGGDSATPGVKTVEIRDIVNTADAPHRFLRVKVTR